VLLPTVATIAWCQHSCRVLDHGLLCAGPRVLAVGEMAKGANFSPDLTAVEEATEQPGLLSSSTPSKPRHATMPVQARALYRKSALYQARNLSTNICIVSAPVLFCILLLLIQTGMSKLMSGAEFQVSA
jgi:hypothetical protein